jgi:ATP-dependent 26S proteasome regulatory subunit
MNQNELIEILEDKLKLAPSNQEVKEQLACLLLAQGDLSRAENLFNEVIKIHPTSQTALWGLAKINWQRHSYEAAYSYMNLLTSMPNNKLTKEQALIFAKVLAKKAKFTDASEWLDTAISQDSSLLQTEMPFLKFIKQNLAQAETKSNGPEGFAIPIPLPFGDGRRSTQYIVLEIAQFDPGMMSSNSGQFVPPEAIDEEPEKEDLSQVKKIITFDQVGGLKKVKQSLIQEVALPLKNPQLCSVFNKTTNPKILLYGPSGCGKTLICRAFAQESEITFFNIRPSTFLDLSYEECEMKLAHLLQQARENKPAVILLDDIDWLAQKPSAELGNQESYLYRSNLLKLILEALSALYRVNDQIGFIATTNAPWHLEPTFFGSAKIDKHIFVGPPSFEDKVELLKLTVEQKQNPAIVPEKIDFVKVIKSWKNVHSGADIEEVLDLAISDLLIETVINIQGGTKEKKLILSTERLIKAGKNKKTVPTVELWMNKARDFLKQKSNPFHHMWEQIEENEQSNASSKICKSIIKNKL